MKLSNLFQNSSMNKNININSEDKYRENKY